MFDLIFFPVYKHSVTKKDISLSLPERNNLHYFALINYRSRLECAKNFCEGFLSVATDKFINTENAVERKFFVIADQLNIWDITQVGHI